MVAKSALIPERSEGLTFIEQLTALAVNSCPNPNAPVLACKDSKTKEIGFVRAGCGLWSCPVCGARNGKLWLARAINGINTNTQYEWAFVTITAHGKWRGKSSLVNIRKNWPKLRKRLARAVDGTFMYLWVYERHKDKSWHVHALVNTRMGTRWWKDNAAQCGMGYQGEELPIANAGQAAGYVAKYLLKQFMLLDPYPKSMRRITTSRSWPKLPPKITPDNIQWIPLFDEGSVLGYAEMMKRAGWAIRNKRTTIKLMEKYKGVDT